MSELSFEHLIELCSSKIRSKVPSKKGPYKNAFNGGHYLGAPGKDIFFALPRLTGVQLKRVIQVHSGQYPKIAPYNHVGYAACIRYIYGQFEKQGVLRSSGDLKRMRNEDIDWSLPRQFMDLLKGKFLENNNNYGMCILYEMEAHRIGDEAILLNDKQNKLLEMEIMYKTSVEYAHKCKSYKQMFTPYYWAARYFMLAKETERAISYAKKTLIEADRFCPDARDGYRTKVKDCINYLRKNMERQEWEAFKAKLLKGKTNKVIRKSI